MTQRTRSLTIITDDIARAVHEVKVTAEALHANQRRWQELFPQRHDPKVWDEVEDLNHTQPNLRAAQRDAENNLMKLVIELTNAALSNEGYSDEQIDSLVIPELHISIEELTNADMIDYIIDSGISSWSRPQLEECGEVNPGRLRDRYNTVYNVIESRKRGRR